MVLRLGPAYPPTSTSFLPLAQRLCSWPTQHRVSTCFYSEVMRTRKDDDLDKDESNQLPPVNLLLPQMSGRNMRPHVIYFTNWPPLRLRWAHYFRMRDHGSSLFSAVKNLHVRARKHLRGTALLSRSICIGGPAIGLRCSSWKTSDHSDSIASLT